MKINDVTAYIEECAPLALAAEWDNPGLIIGDGMRECTGVATCLDCTADVVKQAAEKGANLIVSHHPFIFRPVRSLTAATVQGRCAELLIKYGVSVYAAHTNLDAADCGLSRTLAEMFGGGNLESEEYGCFADIKPVKAGRLAETVAEALGDGTVKVCAEDAEIARIYVVSGAGGDSGALAAAMSRADALITGEVKHHVFTEAAENGFPVIEFSHYYSEIICCGLLKDMIKSRYGDLNVFAAASRRPYKTLEEL